MRRLKINLKKGVPIMQQFQTVSVYSQKSCSLLYEHFLEWKRYQIWKLVFIKQI